MHQLSLIDSCQWVFTRSSCVTNCSVWTITKCLCICKGRNTKVCVHLQVRRYPASSWFPLRHAREKPTACSVVQRKQHTGKSWGLKRFQNWADALATKFPASSRRSCLHWMKKTFDINFFKHYFLGTFAVRSSNWGGNSNKPYQPAVNKHFNLISIS